MSSIDPTASAANSSIAATAAAPAGKTDSPQNQFLQLLVAQLKGQNPLDPMDGTQFVSQLAQFSSLQELTGMHTDLDNIQKYLQPASQAASQQQTSQQTASNPSSIF